MGMYDDIKVHKSHLPEGLPEEGWQTKSLDNMMEYVEITKKGILRQTGGIMCKEPFMPKLIKHTGEVRFYQTVGEWTSNRENWREFVSFFEKGKLLKMIRICILLLFPLTALCQDTTSLSSLSVGGFSTNKQIGGIITFSASTEAWNSFALNIQPSLTISEKVDVWTQASLTSTVNRWTLYAGYLYKPVSNSGFPILLLEYSFWQKGHYSLNLCGGTYFDSGVKPMVKLLITHR